jgi:excisionase family DNA binding protein
MGNLTLSEAARAYGVSKGTISKALSSGRLSGSRHEDGSWEIDPAELARWMETVSKPRMRAAGQPRKPYLEPSGNSPSREPDTHDALVAVLRQTVDDLRADRDAWKDQAQRLLLAPPPSPSVVSRPGLFRRLFGK